MIFYYSFGGAITFARKKDKVIKVIPKDRLLLETDCPYMTPVPYRGQTNEPKRVNIVAEKIAEFLGTQYEEIEKITTKNAYTLFKRLNN